MINTQGLSQQEASTRLNTDGPNELPREGHRTPWKIIRSVISEPMFALLLAAGSIYLVLGDIQESLVLVGFVTLSVGITVIQEFRSERVLDALRDMTSPRALVIRDGQPKRIAGRDVVRGDLLIVNEGDRVPADAFVISGDALQADESLLTGESLAVRKHPAQELPDIFPAPGGEDLPYIYAGTLIVRGGGRAIVCATGLHSEIGKIGQALASIEMEQPRLRMQTGRIVRLFAIGALLFSAGLALLNGFLHGNWLSAILGGIALGMSLLPEEFPLVLTVFMVMGAWRISKARVLTRKAAAIETLGSATVLCTDKTGTLTQNRMSIVELCQNSPDVVEIGALASQKESHDPVDLAFLTAAQMQSPPEKLRHYGLTPDFLAMTNIYSENAKYFAASKGAPETIMQLCRMNEQQASDIRAAMEDMATRGMRVLAVARADNITAPFPDNPTDLSFQFSGLVGLADPLRETVPDAVKEAQNAGIKVIMITGDYPATAKSIAAQAGITAEKVMTGTDLDKITDEELQSILKGDCIFARIMPQQKLRIVNALKANGEIVAMTGDGVNDAPSLKAAHIGIAMGGRGTDVAREASSIVLLDDDFNSLVRTIRLGRRIYDNIRKAFLYILSVHVPIIGLSTLPILFNKPLILTPILIAFLEMVIDPACSVVLEAEEEEENIMKIPPRDPNASILSREILGLGFIQGMLAFVMAGGLWFYASAKNLPEDEIRSLIFATLVTINLALILANRSFSTSLVSAFKRPNPFLWKGAGGILCIFGIAMFWPPAQRLFHFGPLHGHDVTIAILAGMTLLLVLEWLKSIWRKLKL